MKVVLAHDWLIHMRGGEKVLEAVAELFPDATIYTLFYHRKALSPSLARMKIKASFLQRLPGIRKFYRWLLPLFPRIIRSFKIPEADLVISSSHCVAKGVKPPAGAYHICYCHTPIRYAWGFGGVYFGRYPFPLRFIISRILKYVQRWDLETNKSVDAFVANSQNVADRIREFYDRDSEIIYPPVDTEFFSPEGGRKDYYLVVSAFVPYKRVDLVIDTFNHLDRKLLIVGSGPLESEYRRRRRNDQISFLGALSSRQLHKLYAEARALIFPTEEDFGIVPVEAQACGAPVIAYGRGGAVEGVKAGVFFDEQTPEALSRAVKEFERCVWDPKKISEGVRSFGKSRFQSEFEDFTARRIGRSSAHAAR